MDKNTKSDQQDEAIAAFNLDVIHGAASPHPDHIDIKVAKRFRKSPNEIDLGKARTMDDDAAEVLSRYRGELYLHGLTVLSDAAAEILSKHKGGCLCLGGLSVLSDAAAEFLSKHQGVLDLCDLTELSDAAAESLLKHQGLIDLSGLTKLSKAAAEVVSRYQGGLNLSHLTELSDAAAESLSKHRGILLLRGLTELSDRAIESLSKHQGILLLSGLAILSDAAAESLSRFQGGLDLSGLTGLSDIAAESLSKHQGHLDLRSLTELSDAAAESLSKHQGYLHLRGLTELSDAAAGSLSRYQGVLSLYGVAGLSDAAAEAISKHQETVYIGLDKLSDGAARCLSKHKGDLYLYGLTEMSDAGAKSLSRKIGTICDRKPAKWVRNFLSRDEEDSESSSSPRAADRTYGPDSSGEVPTRSAALSRKLNRLRIRIKAEERPLHKIRQFPEIVRQIRKHAIPEIAGYGNSPHHKAVAQALDEYISTPVTPSCQSFHFPLPEVVKQLSEQCSGWAETEMFIDEWAKWELDALATEYVDVENLTEGCNECIGFTRAWFSGLHAAEISYDSRRLNFELRYIGTRLTITCVQIKAKGRTVWTGQCGVPQQEISDLFNRSLPPELTMVYFELEEGSGLYVLMKTAELSRIEALY